MRKPAWAVLALALALPLVLGSCGFFSRESREEVLCPSANGLASASRLTRFANSGSTELTEVAYEAEIFRVRSTCRARRDSVLVETAVEFRITAGPALREVQAVLPYFVAVLDGDRNILTKNNFEIAVEFPDGQTATGYVDELQETIPVPKGGNAADHEVVVGFQLTPDELRFNRQRPDR